MLSQLLCDPDDTVVDKAIYHFQSILVADWPDPHEIETITPVVGDEINNDDRTFVDVHDDSMTPMSQVSNDIHSMEGTASSDLSSIGTSEDYLP